MNKKQVALLRDEQGVILFTVLILLVLLSFLGLWSMSNSSVENDIAGNTRRNQIALYTANAGVEYAMIEQTIYDAVHSVGSTGTYNFTADDGDSNSATPSYSASIAVECIAQRNLPPGSGFEDSDYEGLYYAATSTGSGPNSSQVVIETEYARPIKR